MSPLACKQRTEVLCVVCSLSVSEMAGDVKALEEQIITLVQHSGREFYAKVFAAFQQRWLEEARRDHTAVRWRSINQVTPFGLVRLPVRVVRARGNGRYLRFLRFCAQGLLEIERKSPYAIQQQQVRPAL